MTHTILVTGGAGFIGSMFVGMAVGKGHHVVVLDALTYAGHRANLDWISQSPGSWELVVGDIRDGRLVYELLQKHKVNRLVDFAAESHVDNSIERPSEFIHTNILGCHSILEAARQYESELQGGMREEFRLLHISTDEVYGELGATGKFSEQSNYAPNSPYSASKAAGDMLCRAWHHTFGLKVIVTNCSNNYGPRQHPEKLIPRMISCALAGEKLPIYGDGKNVRDWIHSQDHCRGVFLALEQGMPGETYCFGGDAERTNLEVVEGICATLDALAPRADGKSYIGQKSFITDRPGHDRRYAIDDTKAIRELGFTRQHTFEAGLRDTVKWYLENEDWRRTILSRTA